MIEQVITGTLVVGIIGYFLRGLHTDLKANTKSINSLTAEMGKLKGNIELIDKDARLKHEAHVEKTQIQIQQLTENVDKLTKAVDKLMYKVIENG